MKKGVVGVGLHFGCYCWETSNRNPIYFACFKNPKPETPKPLNPLNPKP